MSKLLYYFFNLRINETTKNLQTVRFAMQKKKENKIINNMNSCCTLSHDNAKYIYIKNE